MVMDLKLCRFESVPWGFRLIGGADFEVPLTVVKVTEGSVADEAGMKVGDIIVRINDEPTSNMTHNDAHQVISKCGNNFFLGVLREDSNEEEENYDEIHQEEQHISSLMESNAETHFAEEIQSTKVETSTAISSELHVESSEIHEEKVIEETIAEMMSGESEVLKEHNVIGVNFNRIFPKAGICQSSEVFRHLNDEAVKTKIEAEKEKRKWTTFLQKPNRPIPADKKEVEEQFKTEPYKIKIVKQAKPRVAPDRVPTPPPEPIVEPEPAEEHASENKTVEEEPIEPPTDSEVPDLELAEGSKVDDQQTEEGITQEIYDQQEILSDKQDVDIEDQKVDKQDNGGGDSKVQKTEEELILEKQLADVQKQLLALSSLPSTIQATLDAVTKQLADLLPTFKLEPQESNIVAVTSENVKLNEEQIPLPESSGGEEHTEEETTENRTETTDDIEEAEEITQITANAIVDVENEQEENRPSSPTPEEKRLEEEQRKAQDELQYKKQKDQQEQLREELQQRLIRDRPPRRPPRAFGPLTPQERPLVLPGGRRWRTPKDAYNDEFIAEILSSQAELITGSTLGSTYESPHLGYDEREYTLLQEPNPLNKRVNFLKYQKPEKKIDLEKSEVYKVIHHLERQPKRGIEVRPPRVLAEEDVRNRAPPMSCG